MESSQKNTGNTEADDIAEVLIVDDDAACLQVLESFVAMAGFRATCAANGDEALALLRSASFTIMITDYNMPGLDGLKLCEEARKIAPELVMVMITGNFVAQLKADAVKLGISAVLAKPLRAGELFAHIRNRSN